MKASFYTTMKSSQTVHNEEEETHAGKRASSSVVFGNCPHCSRQCSLMSPGCGLGMQYAAMQRRRL